MAYVSSHEMTKLIAPSARMGRSMEATGEYRLSAVEKRRDPAGSPPVVHWLADCELRQPFSQEVDLLLELFELPVEHALILFAVGVLEPAAHIARFQLQFFDFRDHVRFGVVGGTHGHRPSL